MGWGYTYYYVLYVSLDDGNSGYFSEVKDSDVYYTEDVRQARHYPDKSQADRAAQTLSDRFYYIDNISVYEQCE